MGYLQHDPYTVAHGSMHAKGQCTLNTRTPHSLTPPTIANMELIEAALVAIESLGPGESINYTAIAKKYGIKRSTLSRRHQAIIYTCVDKGIN